MPRGLSLHIGLNRIDRNHYGTDGVLAGAENDAAAMQALAASLGYRTSTLLTSAACADVILGAIRDAAAQLTAGDTFLLTYAGHGAQVPDGGADEDDGSDETWCAYDRMIVDDELFASWKAFEPQVLIVTVSDSCHSGTMQRATAGLPATYRALPYSFAKTVAYDMHRVLYDGVKDSAEIVARSAVATAPHPASVVSLAAAEDDQLAADGLTNGLFTEKLLQAWDQGRFAGDYASFIGKVRELMPTTAGQTPVYAVSDGRVQVLARQPFALTEAAAPPVAGETKIETLTETDSKCRCHTTQTEETTMMTIQTDSFVDNGNWDEVAAALTKQKPTQRGGGDFMSSVIAANARVAQDAISHNGAPVEAGAVANRGGSVFRAFWWGFHVQVSSADLADVLRLTDPNGEIVRFLYRVIPKEYQYWIAIIAPFVTVTSSVLRSLDRGRGIYISMSWFAAGIFIPTSV